MEDIESLHQQFTDGLIDEETFQRKVQQVAEEAYVPLKNFEVDTDALNREFEGWDSEETKTYTTPE